MSGDLTLYRPGEEPSATLVAGTDGAVPERGDGLEIVGENSSGPEVGAVSAPANFVGTLVDVPPDFDEDATYADGDVIGEVTIRLCAHVEWMNGDDDVLNAGDNVVHDAGGVRALDEVGGDSAIGFVGPVYVTYNKDAGTDGKVAVARTSR